MLKPQRTNRLSSVTVFRVIYLLFVSQIDSKFFTFADAVQQTDNEAIIQLSVDSIHVVKSSDSRFPNIEDKIDDNNERELLISLLNSFDDETDDSNSMDRNDSSSYLDRFEEISSIDKCSLSSSSVRITSTNLKTIRFIPESLDFDEQSIAIPCMQTVTIINDNDEPLELQSLSGTTVHFYSSFFTQRILSAHGGNTTINVFFLPRTLGITRSIFTIQTNMGIFQYYVSGIGVSNPFHLRPLTGTTIPLNSTFEYTIQFHNPHNHSIEINEIYTSDENLIIELLSYRNYRNHIKNNFEINDQWRLEAYETKAIATIHYVANKLDRLHGFYCIKTNFNDTIIVPVEIYVDDTFGLYSNVDQLQFSPDGFVQSISQPISVPIYVINNGNQPVTITNVQIASNSINYLRVHHENIQVPGNIHRLTKIAELTLHPDLISNDVESLNGSVQIFATDPTGSSSITTKKLLLTIPYFATILHGSLAPDGQSTYFFVPSRLNDQYDETKEPCQPVRLTNRFNVPLTIFNSTIENLEIISSFVRVKFHSGYIYASPQQSISPLCITISRRTSTSILFINKETTLTVHTNLSSFRIPLQFYSNLLSLTILNDHKNGGIKLHDSDPSKFLIASIPIGTSRTVRFALVNDNPVDVAMEKLLLMPANSIVQVSEMRAANGTVINLFEKSFTLNSKMPLFTIPAGFQAIISLTIKAGDKVGMNSETLKFQTRYQLLTMHIQYQCINGLFEINNNIPLHIDVFSNRIGTLDINLHNHFDTSIDVQRIDFSSFGKCFSFQWSKISSTKMLIESHQMYQIGKLKFDITPLCGTTQVLSISKSFCGFQVHQDFKRRWEEHVSLLNKNRNKIEYDLVLQFRNLWKDWISLIRKQRIEANIWLTTNMGDVIAPLSVNFVWPSVFEHMWSTSVSRTPIILDFHLVILNMTKTQNIIISNPSSKTISYSIHLVARKEQGFELNTIENPLPFNISIGSKLISTFRNQYEFTLEPQEHLVFTASYQPQLSVKDEVFLVVQNDLTIIESILMRGEGTTGSLTVGNRPPGSSDIPLLIEVNENEHKLCSGVDQSGKQTDHFSPILHKIIALRNTGNVKIIIQEISFGDDRCSARGFSLSACSSIQIEPDDRYDLILKFQPDFTLAEINDQLILHTNIGRFTFPLIVRIPKRVLTHCYQTIPRPNWESKTSWLCICSLPLICILIIGSALIEARRLICESLTIDSLSLRKIAEHIRGSNVTPSNPIEPKTDFNDSLELRTNTGKKDNLNYESRVKNSENKARRSISSTNGVSKETLDNVAKTQKHVETNNSTVRSAPSPKSTANKVRRTGNENVTTKSTKHENDSQNSIPALKSSSVKSQKVLTNSSVTTTQPRSITPPMIITSSDVSDDESGFFQPARPKRTQGKTKELGSTLNSTKIPTNGDDSGLKRASPSPSIQPISNTNSSKVSTMPDFCEQPNQPIQSQQQQQQSTQNAKDPIQSNGVSNDQRRSIPNPTRCQRKASTAINNRRDPAEESHTDIKIQKSTTTNNEFRAYISPPDSPVDDSADVDDWSQTKSSTMTDIPPLMSIGASSINPLASGSPPKSDELYRMMNLSKHEPVPIPHHAPGPIQRPNKLSMGSSGSSNPVTKQISINQKPMLPSSSPDVLDQINDLLYANTAAEASINFLPIVGHPSVVSPMVNDVAQSPIQWSPFPANNWGAASQEQSWNLPTLQSSPMQLNSYRNNSFSNMAMIPERRQNLSQTLSPPWGTGLNSTAPPFVYQRATVQGQQQWNDTFSGTVPSAAQTSITGANGWHDSWLVTDPTGNRGTLMNGQRTTLNDPLWSSSELGNDSVVPSSDQVSESTANIVWWPTALPDENNNRNSMNHDNPANRDQSRWDFAR